MGGATEAAHRGAGAKVRGDAKALRRKRGARRGSRERAGTPRATRKNHAAENAGCARGSEGGTERRGGANDFGVATGSWSEARITGSREPRKAATRSEGAPARLQQSRDPSARGGLVGRN